MTRKPDTGTLLDGNLYRASCTAGCPIVFVASKCTRWASATFSGLRHVSSWTATPTAELDRWLTGLTDATITLRGHLLADIAVVTGERTESAVTLEISVLTVAE